MKVVVILLQNFPQPSEVIYDHDGPIYYGAIDNHIGYGFYYNGPSEGCQKLSLTINVNGETLNMEGPWIPAPSVFNRSKFSPRYSCLLSNMDQTVSFPGWMSDTVKTIVDDIGGDYYVYRKP